jgi:hypothetical protein
MECGGPSLHTAPGRSLTTCADRVQRGLGGLPQEAPSGPSAVAGRLVRPSSAGGRQLVQIESSGVSTGSPKKSSVRTKCRCRATWSLPDNSAQIEASGVSTGSPKSSVRTKCRCRATRSDRAQQLPDNSAQLESSGVSTSSPQESPSGPSAVAGRLSPAEPSNRPIAGCTSRGPPTQATTGSRWPERRSDNSVRIKSCGAWPVPRRSRPAPRRAGRRSNNSLGTNSRAAQSSRQVSPGHVQRAANKLGREPGRAARGLPSTIRPRPWRARRRSDNSVGTSKTRRFEGTSPRPSRGTCNAELANRKRSEERPRLASPGWRSSQVPRRSGNSVGTSRARP